MYLESWPEPEGFQKHGAGKKRTCFVGLISRGGGSMGKDALLANDRGWGGGKPCCVQP